ncbi:hypothetical protein IMF27_05615 [Pseudomonas sp. PCH199]|uniref:hypothetical protein n=1 Tax=unclassified Pseudomonas TaxID=196821 RepID=UPI000BCE1337|nr:MULTISPECIES: hypothetical protein [unclassified Pseudomonas]MCW8275239.1 hypothetical protein [Pseudomonas sp. PCH199]PAM84907.1 hypothetical protein CES87_05760 [Pseudomonas sp. ERMR1:02]
MPIKGFDALTQRLKQLAEDAEAFDGTHSVPLSEALTHSFLSEHSRFTSADDFLAAGGFELESVDDFKAMPEEMLDAYVQSETSFSSWKEMLGAAMQLWTKKRLGLL